MNDDKISAYATLYEVLESLSRLLAPFLPFVADEIYRHMVIPVDPDAPESVHLADYPAGDSALIDANLESAMEAVMRCVTLVRAARNRTRIKVKQPLAGVRVSLREKVDPDLLSMLIQHVTEEVNIKDVRFEEDLSDFVSYEVVPKFDVLGPVFGPRIKAVQQELAGLDTASILRLDNGGSVSISIEGEEVEIEAGSVEVRKTEKEGYVFESDGASAIVLDIRLTPQLIAEGYAREIVSGIQKLRKQSGFDVTDNIRVHMVGGGLTDNAVELFGEHIRTETLALSIDDHLPDGAEPAELKVGDEKVSIVLERA
jgi:isoleucyl-tRNA synthetase